MILKIKENSIDFIELKSALIDEFGDTYKIAPRTKSGVTITKNKMIGTMVILQKRKLVIAGNFASAKINFIYTMLMVLLGIIIPLIIYFIVFHKKMKIAEKEVELYKGSLCR